MTDFALSKELSRKIAQDLGATPVSIGKTSMTHNDLSIKSLKVQVENDLVKNIPMWYGEAIGSLGKTCCLLSAIEPNPDSLELAAVIGFKDFEDNLQEGSPRVGFRYDWANPDDKGTWIIKSGDKWIELSLAQKLQLCLGFEHMVQDGIQWNPGSMPDELRKDLSEIIEVDE